MKQLLLIISLLPQGLLQAQVRKVPAETAIQAVTVFSSGAQIQRTATVAVQPGRSEIQFTNLSNQLDAQSVQLKADAAITLLSVQAVKDFFGERKVEQEEKALLEKQAGLKDKIDADNKLLEVYKQEEAMLIKNQAIGGSTGVKAAELQAALDLHRQRLTELYQKQLETTKRVQLAQQEWERTRMQIGEMGKKRDSVHNSVVALIESKETRSIRFTLTYTVKDAGWYATYDVRVGEVGKPIDLTMTANVFQRSGETWKDVALLLSTGNPTDNATPSQLQPWQLNFYDPSTAWMRNQRVQPGVAMGRVTNNKNEPVAGATVQVRSGSSTVTDANGFFKLQNLPVQAVAVVSAVGFESKSFSLKPGYFNVQLNEQQNALDEVVVVGYGTQNAALEGRVAGAQLKRAVAAPAKQEELQTVAVTTDYKPTTTVYAIEDKYTLETDGKTTIIPIRKLAVPALFEYYAAPKLDPAAFLTAKITSWQELDLQPGEASLFFEGTYLGKTYLDLANAGDTLGLALGKDNGIRVQRKLVKEFTAKRLIGANRTETKAFEITVRNNKRIPITVIVEDQFPVSVNKEIEVDEQKAPDAQWDRETGLLTWNVSLAPGEEKKLTSSYRVRYPKDRKVVLE
ncbi:DUF4139 domain-containing protein [Paracnuella aquatica]|uniref:DUF4139 domain-containing protein n=1 Tax=Paracnuella aquatica TaxID=2268757 RepID=UPI00138FB7DD|nr:DUF4139 domain-containing protein [Paracnuella aquatica]